MIFYRKIAKDIIIALLNAKKDKMKKHPFIYIHRF